MTAGEQRDKSLIDHRLLAEDDSSDAFPHQGQALPERLDLGDEFGLVLLVDGVGFDSDHGRRLRFE